MDVFRSRHAMHFSGRILMETPRPPTIIPMWITGASFLPPPLAFLVSERAQLTQASTNLCQKAAMRRGSTSHVQARA
jgi:hypothetical protein